jgi:hypothetical protein
MNVAVKKLLVGKTGVIAENKVKELLRAYRIPTTTYQVIHTEKDLN